MVRVTELRSPAWWLALMVIACGCGSRSVAAQGGSYSRWRIGIGAAFGAPAGWVQVRERAIEGTRLHFRRDLGVRSDHSFQLHVEYRRRPGDGFGVTVSSWTLRGAAILPADVLFNGTTLAGRSTLITRTDFPHFIRVDMEGWRRISKLGRRGSLAGSLGLTAVFLTYTMSGTESPKSIGHETKEDFVTQELPVPIAGLRLHYPLGGRLTLSAAISGGLLPWVNSLRREGGMVRITQGHADSDLCAELAVNRELHLLADARFSEFTQREKSREDGNDIHLRSTLLVLGIARDF
jgi:hypothetical protein